MMDAAAQPGTLTPFGARGVLDRLGSQISLVASGVAVTLVAVEVVLLFVGVVCRYALHRPLEWSDELAGIIFVWLVMIGSTVAVRRNEHMRMTALVANMPLHARTILENGLSGFVAGLLLILTYVAVDYAVEEATMTTPLLEISAAWRAAAMPIGLGGMACVLLLRMAAGDRAAWLQGLAGLGVLVGGAILLTLARPGLVMLGNWNLILFFVVAVIVTVSAALPIAFCFVVAAVAYLVGATTTPLLVIVGRIEAGMSHLILLSIPLFVFLGLLMEATGIARNLVRLLASLFGHVRGGLSYVLVAAMYLVSGISGSKAADMAAVAPVLFPEMKKRGSDPGDLVALLSATGAQTETIPPSLVLITVGAVTGTSIAALFTGGLVPALFLGMLLCTVVWFRARRQTRLPRAAGREITLAFGAAMPGLLLPVIIRFAVVEGIATATEVATIGVAYCFLIGLALRERTMWKRLPQMLAETASLSGSILLIVGSATAMAWGLTQSGFADDLAKSMIGLPGGRTTFLAISIVAFLVLGSLLEGIPAIVVFGPLLFPAARALGIHDVHYAIVVITAMGIGLFAPPFGVGYYFACAVGRVDPKVPARPLVGYLAVLMLGLVVLAAVPWLSLSLL